ncbi:MAG: Type IV pilin [Candidatus Levybacteria bacterium GW2011_GWA1_39_11]|nr:MAG: Type IV pilin [Candidatus Levybacteria bacterium GW2011_GWA1_39_11]
MKPEKISLSSKDRLSLISNMSTMFNAGIPIIEIVDSLLEDSKGSRRKILEALRDDLMQGKHLYVSFSRFPKVFDKVTINIIKASEEAGTLDVTLKDLRKQIKEEIEFNDKIKSALTYPLIIAVVFFGVLLLILLVVVPKISTVFSRLRVDLPLPTKILIFISNALLNYTIPTVLGIIALIFLLVFILKTKKELIQEIFFSLPLVKTLVKQIDLTRFSRSMYLLLTSGITITTALELTQDVVMNRDVSRAIAHARDVVLGGKRMSEGFKEKKNVLPALMIKIVEAGEKTGSLENSMQDISEYLDYEVSNTLRNLTALLEPLMLVVIGVLVGGMMLAIIAPIYGLIGNVGLR